MANPTNIVLIDELGNDLNPYVKPATTSSLGTIKVGSNLSITADGTLSAQGGSGVVDQTYNPVSVNAQSGVAIAGARFQFIDQPITYRAVSGTVSLTDNTVYAIEPTDAIIFELPITLDQTKYHQILIQLNMSIVYNIDLGLGNTPQYFNEEEPDMSAAGMYNLLYEYDRINNCWVAGCIRKGVAV